MKLSEENEKLKKELKRAKRLLKESLNHLDRDFSWEISDEFEEKVRRFLKMKKKFEN